MNKENNSNEKFGGLFAHAYIVPKDMFGVSFIRWIALRDDEAIREAMCNSAVESGEYEDNTTNKSLFPLRVAGSDIEAAVCMTMDAKQISVIQYHAKNNPHHNYEILCLDWQEEYLRRVLPDNILYRTFNSSIIE